jgi:hypothetical protein
VEATDTYRSMLYVAICAYLVTTEFSWDDMVY